jgi:hypothetical protein
MNTKLFPLVVSVVIFGLVVSGCAKPPEMEIAAAKAALEEARTAEANRYAKAEYDAATNALSVADNEVANQNSKFALLRNYKQAKELYASATTASQTAKDAAAANKEKVRNEVSGLITQIQTGIDEAKTLMTNAPKGKEGKEALEAISGDLTMVETSLLPDVNTVMSSGDYLRARDQATSTLAKVDSIKSELQAAIDKYTQLKSGARR